MKTTPVYLCILDGFALGENGRKNAIFDADKEGRAPFINDLFAKHPFAKLECSGLAVGLPAGTMGNSEVNHLNMGAGRIVAIDVFDRTPSSPMRAAARLGRPVATRRSAQPRTAATDEPTCRSAAASTAEHRLVLRRRRPSS